MGEKHGHRRRRRGRRDFWRAWREEWQDYWEEQDDPRQGIATPPPPPPPRMVARAWREFFHEYMGAWPEEHWAFGGRRFSPWHKGMDSFNPFVASLLSKGGGLLPLLVMDLLAQQARYGNELMELIGQRTGGQWVANPGAVYPLLTMLEKQGYVVGKWEDPRKRTVRIYHLTESGEQELVRLKAVVRPKLAEAAEVLQRLTHDLNGDSSDEQPPTVQDEITQETK
ncbi:MAG: PadR family transcriptional regulator [Chloroflexota bacterium]|nr:PadR family transcriptional regulator [Chloroflexota bacterium]